MKISVMEEKMYNFNNNYYEKCFPNSVSAQLVPDLIAYYYFFMWLAGRQASQPSLEKKKTMKEMAGIVRCLKYRLLN